jgi:hypothetical protein
MRARPKPLSGKKEKTLQAKGKVITKSRLDWSHHTKIQKSSLKSSLRFPAEREACSAFHSEQDAFSLIRIN